MKAVIKFTNGSGQTEYWGRYGFVKCLLDAKIHDYEDDAFHMIHNTKLEVCAPSIWKTAIVQPVKLVEV
jgi:hypothetical protein